MIRGRFLSHFFPDLVRLNEGVRERVCELGKEEEEEQDQGGGLKKKYQAF